jgi:outer membrane immunogenic protein
MKRMLLTAASLAALAGSIGTAVAADMGAPPPYMPTKAPYFMPVYNWTGLYAGINGGGEFGRSNWSAVPSNFSVNGGMVGGQLGYNWQFGQFVWGLEGDLDYISGHGTTSVGPCAGAVCQTNTDFLGTFRGRAGYAFDRFMPYITGGLAVGNIRASDPFGPGIAQANAGWTIGAGVEMAIAGPWTAKLEYLHVDLGNARCDLPCGAPPGTNSVSLTEEVVRAGINYRF